MIFARVRRIMARLFAQFGKSKKEFPFRARSIATSGQQGDAAKPAAADLPESADVVIIGESVLHHDYSSENSRSDVFVELTFEEIRVVVTYGL